MTTPARWILAAVAALLVVALLIWARGNEHHHGIQVGSMEPVGTVMR
ncbi:MAG: hypothetical protein ABWZ91_14040 [Nocardioides sp.]